MKASHVLSTALILVAAALMTVLGRRGHLDWALAGAVAFGLTAGLELVALLRMVVGRRAPRWRLVGGAVTIVGAAIATVGLLGEYRPLVLAVGCVFAAAGLTWQQVPRRERV